MDGLIRRAAGAIGEANAVIIAASNGLSITEGLNIFAGDRLFQERYGDLVSKCGARNLLELFFSPHLDALDKWIMQVRYFEDHMRCYAGSAAMADLAQIVGDNYFIVTSNGEGHFELAGFSADRIYNVEGSAIALQCEANCGQPTWEALPTYIRLSKLLKEHAALTDQRTAVRDQLPTCQRCGNYAVPNTVVAATFQEDSDAIQRWSQFLKAARGRRIAILELGVGPANRMLKAPLMSAAVGESGWSYISINKGQALTWPQLGGRGISLNLSIESALRQIKGALCEI